METDSQLTERETSIKTLLSLGLFPICTGSCDQGYLRELKHQDRFPYTTEPLSSLKPGMETKKVPK